MTTPRVAKRGRPRLRVVHRRVAEAIDPITDQQVIQAVGLFSTVIAGIDEKGNPAMHGSGTLVTVKGRALFLTAHHVLYGKGAKKGLMHFPGWCVWLSRYGRQPVYARDLFVGIPIAAPTLRAGEPDLAAVLLPLNVETNLRSFEKAFYRLDGGAVIEPEDVATKPGALMVTAGAPAEYTTESPEGRTSVFLLGYGRTMAIQRRRGFSFISLGVSYKDGAFPPRSFEGMSGGGVWIVPTVEGEGGAARVDGRATLIGVVFRQIARNNRVTSVRCHGSRDIYELAVNEIGKAIAGGQRLV